MVVVIPSGEEINVFESVEGDTVSGSNEWLVVLYQGTAVYVHSSLAVQVAPPTPTKSVNTSSSVTYYVNSTGRVNIRSCASTGCDIIETVSRGDELQVIDTQGDWHVILLSGNSIGYIATSLVSRNLPSTLAPVPQQPGQQSVPPQNQSQAPAWNCSGDRYNCGDFSTCGEVTSYWNACPGDPSRLDGDNDGKPCETLCGG